MDVLTPVRSAIAILSSVSVPFAAQTAHAMGHGPILGLEHFVRASTQVHMAVVPSGTALPGALANFELGGGKRLVVTALKPAGARSEAVRSINWPRGQVLAFLEHTPPRTAQVLFSRAGKHLVILAPQEYITLQKDPRIFVAAVEAQVLEHAMSEAPSARVSTFPAARFQPEQAVRIEASALMKNLRALTGLDPVTVDGRSVTITERGGQDGRTSTQLFLRDHFASLGLESGLKCYTRPNGSKGCNVVATHWGADTSKVVYFTAHLDSVRNKGADDDGSGIAAIMEIARIVSRKESGVSFRFVGWDQEELGLIGSKAYAGELRSNPPTETIAGVYQMDMIGYDSDNDGAYHVMDCNRADSKPLTRLIDSVNAGMNLGLKKVDACTNRSDHASFWNENIPATLVSENFFGDDDNRCYHRACDTVDIINQDYFAKISTLMANVAVALSEGR